MAPLTNAATRARLEASIARKAASRKKVAKSENRAGRPTAEELERRKARVIEVATELFVDQGYAATSLVEIAKAAGVATRTVYQHYGDKEDLFREVIFARDSNVVTPAPTVEPTDTLHTALDRAARYILTISLSKRTVDLMRLMVAESARFPDLIKGLVTVTFSRFRQNVTQVFALLAAYGVIPHGDHPESAELFIDIILGTSPIMIYTNWESAQMDDSVIEKKIDFFIMGRFGAATAKISRTRLARPRSGKGTPKEDKE